MPVDIQRSPVSSTSYDYVLIRSSWEQSQVPGISSLTRACYADSHPSSASCCGQNAQYLSLQCQTIVSDYTKRFKA